MAILGKNRAFGVAKWQSAGSHRRRGHATLVEMFTNRSSSYAGSLALVDDEILVTPGSSGSLEKATYQRTITEKFDYTEEDGQFAREGTVTDVTERTAERLETANGQDAEETATLTSRRDGDLESTDSFAGTFSEDGAGRRASPAAKNNGTARRRRPTPARRARITRARPARASTRAR